MAHHAMLNEQTPCPKVLRPFFAPQITSAIMGQMDRRNDSLSSPSKGASSVSRDIPALFPILFALLWCLVFPHTFTICMRVWRSIYISLSLRIKSCRNVQRCYTRCAVSGVNLVGIVRFPRLWIGFSIWYGMVLLVHMSWECFFLDDSGRVYQGWCRIFFLVRLPFT